MDEFKSPLEHSEEIISPKIVLDEEGTEALLVDCHLFLEELSTKKNPIGIQSKILKLLPRIEEVLSWYKLH